MNHDITITERSYRRSFARALAWVIAPWAMAAVVMVAVVNSLNPALLSMAVIIAIASVLIACLSMLPGLLRRAQSGGIVVAVMAGIMIRLIGTVALFLTCRYHMASPVEMIAAMTIGWYVLLTSIEVFVLIRESPRDATPSAQPSMPSRQWLHRPE